MVFVQYSPLCDSDKQVYQEYLALEKQFLENGWSSSVPVGRVGDDGFTKLLVDSGSGFLVGGSVDSAGVESESAQGSMGRFLVGEVVSGDGASGSVGQSGVCSSGVDVEANSDDEGSGRDRVESGVKGCLGRKKEVLGKNKPGKKMRERLARQAARRVRGSDRSDWRQKEGDGEKGELRKSLEAKWAAENALASARAKHQLELLEKVDVDQVAKVQETKCKKAIEANMVAMEKAHAFLRATGNVPGEVGFCQTVVSDDGVPVLSSGSGSPVCTISPDSSASMKEFRECQKKLLDAEAELKRKDEELLKKNELLVKYGLEKYVKYGEKKTFTVGEDGRIPESLLDEMYPDGYIGEVMSDGKYRAVGMCIETGLPYTEDGSILGKIEQIKEDKFYAGCN